MTISRRRFIGIALGASGLGIASAYNGWRQGWLVPSTRPGIQTARLLIAVAHQYQTDEGDILGNPYLTHEFAKGVLAAELNPRMVKTPQGRSIYHYYADQLKVDSVGSRQVTDSISRLLTTVALGFDSDYRRGEAEYLIERRVREDEKGFLSIQNPGASLAYLPFGLIALQAVGVSRDNTLVGRMRALLDQLRNPDGGYPEVPGGESVVDISAAVIMAGANQKDGLTQQFIAGLRTWEGFRYSWVETPEFLSPTASAALVQQALPKAYNIPQVFMARWFVDGRLGMYPSKEEEIYDLCAASQALGRATFKQTA